LKAINEKRNFNNLLVSQSSSNFANSVGTVLISLLLYDLTGSMVAMGSLLFVSMSAQIIIQLAIGPMIDNWDRLTVMKVSEFIRISVFLGLIILSYTDNLNPIHLYTSSFLISVVLYGPAANALLPNIVSEEFLLKGNSRIEGFIQVARMIALPVAGVVKVITNDYFSLSIVFILFLISFFVVFRIDVPKLEGNEKRDWWNQLKEGLSIYKTHTILIILGIFIAVINFGVFATQAMYVPYVREAIGAGDIGYGFFVASFPFGYVLGTSLTVKLKFKTPETIIMMFAVLLSGLTFFGLSVATTLWVAIIMEIIAGIAMPFWNVYSTTIFQKLVPDHLRGQVFTVRNIIAFSMTPAGIIFGTFMAELFGLRVLFTTIGSITLTSSLLGIIIIYRKYNYSVLSTKIPIRKYN